MTRFLESKDMDENYSALVDFYYLSWLQKEAILIKGIRKPQLSTLRNLVSLTWGELAELLSVTDRTLHLWHDNHRISDCFADRFMLYVETFSLLYNAIPDRAESNTWLRTRCWELGARMPLEVMETYPGLLAVELFLKRKLYHLRNSH